MTLAQESGEPEVPDRCRDLQPGRTLAWLGQTEVEGLPEVLVLATQPDVPVGLPRAETVRLPLRGQRPVVVALPELELAGPAGLGSARST